MNNYQIFISYRRDGGDALAGRIADRLIASGFKVFYDVETMRSGQFNSQILDAISQCDDFLIILPPNALDRCVNVDDWLRIELSYALKNNKNIIPIMMRNFTFPQTLPDDIDQIRHMEGITASYEFFDSVIEKIKKMLVSTSRELCLPSYSIDTKEHYKITTPLISPYKCVNDIRDNYLLIGAFTRELYMSTSSPFHWCPPVKEGITINSLRDYMVGYGNDEAAGEWHDKNIDKLNSLQAQIKALKQYDDFYFYNNAIIFAMGTFYTILDYNYVWRRYHLNEMIEVLCYCLDISSEFFFNGLNDAFTKDKQGQEDFRNLIPLAFEAWPEISKNPTLDSKYKQNFDTFCILLFDFMIDLAIFINDSINDLELKQTRSTQIRCYYKWLKKNKIYLPKELQYKIYRYL